MKMSPAAKAYLISGYPRSMRDVVEYTEKIQVLNGVILISWRQSVLKKQIDFGAKLGHVVLSLAKMELENFFKSVMPVADYFDQSDMLVAINGERAPSEVYKDFRAAVLDILQAQENQEAVLNGVAGIGHGNDEIPGSIVSVETAPKQEPIREREAMVVTTPPNAIDSPITVKTKMNGNVGKNVIEVETIENRLTDSVSKIPPVIFVLGGPGSNKAMLCLKAVGMNAGWSHFSIGRSLRTLAESDPKPLTENFAIKESLTAGEMVSKDSLDKLIHTNILQLLNKKGIIIDGYPRDINQVYDFEEKYNQKPPIILLDCSKLQLGRGRLDDSVSAFRRRLELFRELTLPMLKSIDSGGRLTIIDGDPDSVTVQREFERVIKQYIDKLSGKALQMNGDAQPKIISGLYNRNSQTDPQRMGKQRMNEMNDGNLHDSMPGVIPTISNHVTNYVNNNHQNGYVANGHLGGNKNYTHPRTNTNGYIPNGRPNLRSMLQDAEMDSHM
ncbi:hypothetical protein ACKWTF_001148 [Chironomus riparius]